MVGAIKGTRSSKITESNEEKKPLLVGLQYVDIIFFEKYVTCKYNTNSTCSEFDVS